MPYDLTCLDCGAAGTTVKRRDAKYCHSCRLRRALTFVESGKHKMRSTRKCRTCSTPYRMTHAKDLTSCGHCDTASLPTTEQAALADCSWCGSKVHSRSALPSICLGCQSSPEERKRLRRGLQKGFTDRKQQNASVLAALASGAPHLRRID